MSWDIFAQDIPPDVKHVDEISSDFETRLIRDRSRVLKAIRLVAPGADMSDPSWVRIDDPTSFSIEVNLGNDERLTSFAFHVRGGEEAAVVVAAIFSELRLRAFDPQSETGLFDAASNEDEF